MSNTIFSSDFFSTVKSKVSRIGWAREALDKLTEHTWTKVNKPLDIPLTGGGWSHNYNCPNDGDRLQLVDRHHHKCPSCGSIWSGTPWDEVAIANEHWQISIGCRDASVLYGITGESRWLEWAKSVLLFYAEHYDEFPLHDKYGGTDHTSGKVQCQTLSESSWLIPLAQAFYILQQLNAVSEQEKEMVTKRLLEPAVQVIKMNPAGMSNWQTYHNAAKAWTAAATNNQLLFEEVLHDPNNGFYFQMEHSLGDDGFWYEGAWGYHFYTLEAQVMIVLAAACFDIPLYENSRFQSMFRAPLACMFPDGTLPPVHDSGEVNVMKYFHLYEFAFAKWKSGREMIERSPRHFLYSLLFGEELTEEKQADSNASSEWRTQDLKRAGMLFVKRMTENPKDALSVMIDYGEHGGSHGHRDKMNLLYYAKGHPWLTDAGTVPYGNPMYKQFFKHTLPHNTVAIGGISQKEAEGRLIRAGETADGFVIEAEVDHAYEGFTLRRKLIASGHDLIDIFGVDGDHQQTIDWIVHTQGLPMIESGNARYSSCPDGTLGSADAYSYLRAIRKIDPGASAWRFTWQWDQEEHAGELFEVYGFSNASDQEELWLAESPALPAIKKRSTFIRRRTGPVKTKFVTVFRACQAGAKPLQLDYDEKEEMLRITEADGQTRSISTRMN